MVICRCKMYGGDTHPWEEECSTDQRKGEKNQQ